LGLRSWNKGYDLGVTYEAFLPFRLDLVNECLWRKRERRPDERVPLTPKTFAVLRYLVDHAGQLVTHDQLLDEVWRATHVQPQAVKREILYLRRGSKESRYIETLHRRGYRFVAAVRESAETGVVVPSQLSSTKMVGTERSRFSELREHLEKAIRGERQSVFITGVWKKCAKASVARPDRAAFVVLGT
jgi:DNA-binding winged helix-turn-helix (wHTH) protein